MSDDQVRLQFFVSKEVAERLDQLGEHVQKSRNEVAAWIVSAGTSDEEWLLNSIVARLAGAVKRLNRKRSGEVKP